MLIAEIFLSIIIVFSAGAYVGQEQGKKSVIIPEKRPEVWPPSAHEKMIRECSIVCGRNKVKSYDIIYGRCECK